MHADRSRHQFQIVMRRENTRVASLLNRVISVEVDFSHLSSDFFRNINDPVSCHPRVSSIRFFENILFRDFGDSVVVESKPAVVEAISNKCIVVARLSITVMHTDPLELVGMPVHPSIGFFDVGMELIKLGLHC